MDVGTRDALVCVHWCVAVGQVVAFGTLYAEAQRRYLESVAPYARRLFHEMGILDVDEIDGIPPAVALPQQRGTPTTRSCWGSEQPRAPSGGVSPRRAQASFAQPAARAPERAYERWMAGVVIAVLLVGNGDSSVRQRPIRAG